jgi:hypothetical protein
VSFIVDKVALGEVLQFSLPIVIPPIAPQSSGAEEMYHHWQNSPF